MGRKTSTGLCNRKGIWHIDKRIRGYGRLCESTGERTYEAAEQYLELRVQEIKKERFGRPQIRWRQAATRYLQDNVDKSNIKTEAGYLADLDAFIGDLYLHQVHDDTLRTYVQYRREQGKKTKTINNALGVIRHILNISATSWRHVDSGQTWLERAPKITMQRPPKGLDDSRKPYPLDWEEQDRLVQQLPVHLARMALFMVNVGCREKEVTGLKWEWEQTVNMPDFQGRIFLIPGNVVLFGGSSVKNREDRLVICNDVAKSVLDSCRGDHPEYVFTTQGHPVTRMNNTAWKRAWKGAGLPVGAGTIRGVHNLKHTCGRRLRAAGVSWETRQVLLGHTNGSITTHYSAPELQELLEAVQRISRGNSRNTPALVILRPMAVNG